MTIALRRTARVEGTVVKTVGAKTAAEHLKDPLWLRFQVVRGQRRADLGEPILRELLAREPLHPFATTALAHVLVDLRRIDEAVLQAQEAVRQRPNFAHAHHAMARALMFRGDIDGALQHAAQAIRLRPNISVYYRLSANIHLTQNRFEAAVEYAERGLQIAAEDHVLQRLRAVGLAGIGRYEEAENAAVEVLRLTPNDAWAFNCAGHVARLSKRLDVAEERYREGLRIDPRCQGGHAGLGLIRHAQGKTEEARAMLLTARDLDWTDLEVHQALAEIDSIPATKGDSASVDKPK